jgi:hypothetical protein
MPQTLYPQGKSLRYPLDVRLGEPQSLSGRLGEEEISPLLELELWYLCHLASRYTDWAIPAPAVVYCLQRYYDI